MHSTEFTYNGQLLGIVYNMDPELLICSITWADNDEVDLSLISSEEFRYAFIEYVTTNQREIL